jgi:hypothetical protein
MSYSVAQAYLPHRVDFWDCNPVLEKHLGKIADELCPIDAE